MGMYGRFKSLRTDILEIFKNHEILVETFLCAEPHESFMGNDFMDYIPKDQLEQYKRIMENMKMTSDPWEDLKEDIPVEEYEKLAPDIEKIKAEWEEASFSVDKFWQALHFLITGKVDGSAHPLSDAVLGGTEIGDDLGSGPARYLSAEKVKEVYQGLSELSIEMLKKSYNAELFSQNKVYPMEEWSTDDINHLIDLYQQMVQYYKEASEKNRAMLLYIG